MFTRLKKLAAVITAGIISLTSNMISVSAASSEDTFRAKVLNAWKSYDTNISMTGLRMTLDDCVDIYYDMLYRDSDWFYISSSFAYTLDFTNRVSKIIVQYNYDKDEIPALINTFNAKVDDIVSMCDESWSDAEKVLFFHDYLASHCVFDEELVRGDAFAALVDGCAVCQGYALAMNILCREVGIPCCSIVSDTQMHMWNLVKINDKWYHLDITYDDPTPDIIGQTSHQFVLQSDAYMMSDSGHTADDWEYFSDDTISCNDETYSDAFWIDSIDAITVLEDGSWLMNLQSDPMAVSSASEIGATILHITKNADGSYNTEPIYKLNTFWSTPEGSIYRNCYSYAEVFDDTIYYTTADKIYSINMDGTNRKVFYTLSPEEKKAGSIYGMTINENGLLSYQLMKQPGYTEEVTVLDVKYGTIQLEVPFEETTTTTETTTTSTTTTTTTTFQIPQWQMELIPPTKLNYSIGEQLDYTGAAASVFIQSFGWEQYYYRVSNQPITSQYFKIDDSAFDSSKEGTYRIVVSYAEDSSVSAYFDVNVAAVETTTSSTTTSTTTTTTTTTYQIPKWQMDLIPPSKLTYSIGEQLDYTGATASVYIQSFGWEQYFYRVANQPITSQYFIIDDSAFDSETAGTYRIIVTYVDDNSLSAYFDVTVVPQETTTSVTTATTSSTSTTSTTTSTSTTTTTTTTIEEPPVVLYLGDANVDGDIDVSDVILIARVSAEDVTATITTQGKYNADYNQDGKINSLDASLIVKFIAKLIA